MFSTPKFFNLNLRSLGFIIAITSIFYHVHGLLNVLIHVKTEHGNIKDDIGLIERAFFFNFTWQKNRARQVNTEGGDVLSEDSFLDALTNILCYAPLVNHILTLIVCPLLLVALIKRKPVLIWPWLIYWAAALIFNWVICIIVILYMASVDTHISAEQLNYTAHQCRTMGLYLALWVAMLSLRKEEKNENTS